MRTRKLLLFLPLLVLLVALLGTSGQSFAGPAASRPLLERTTGEPLHLKGSVERITMADREAAARRAAVARVTNPLGALYARASAAIVPTSVPNYFSTIPNYALSQLPSLNSTGGVIPGTGIRKFVDSLPGLGASNANNLGQYMPVATPDTTAYPGSDYYVIALAQYTEKLHSDVPTTTLRGYVQLSTSELTTLTPPHYLGPVIVANKNRPVRVKFINKLPTGTGGDLFLPVDTTLMGAGAGPTGGTYKQNRGTLHLHGGNTPWISDGTPHQWTTPAGEVTPYPKGVSVRNVPDMPAAGPGRMTFFYSNQQSARLMFYHDHSYGITRLNVYAGEAAPYLLNDPVEDELINGNVSKPPSQRIIPIRVQPSTIPTEQIPLVIQDKTFVPNWTQMAAQDPTWDTAKWGGAGNLWFPHVYMPNQNPFDNTGINPMGRWDYASWVYPPLTTVMNGPLPNPRYGQPGQPPQIPGTPLPTVVPEAFMDTPVVNGTAYPFLKVQRKAYRFRILNACNDRALNLQLYYAESNTPDATDTVTGLPTLQTLSGDVTMVAAAPSTSPTWPATWPTDGRAGGIPSPEATGPTMIQIGTEGGFLPAPAELPNNPVGYEYNRRTILVLNVTNHTLMLGPAERADVIVDFSQVPDGAKLILYQDMPAPIPGFDTRCDYYTGDPDQTSMGGAPTTKAGYGPNTRTIMQFQVEGPAASPFNLTRLQTALPAAYGVDQPKPIVPEAAYGPAFGTTYPNTYARVIDTTMTFTPADTSTPITMNFTNKAIIEGFDTDYGRMNAQLGTGLPNVGPAGGAASPAGYADPPTQSDVVTNTPFGVPMGTLQDGTQIWQIEHQGVDTHAIHFHLFNVQLINRVAIDATLRPPDANELGWKETIRMNPGETVIVALRPAAQSQKLPWKLQDSVRPANPLVPVGSTYTDAQGNPVVNAMTNFGWEYVWHCHLLGHEENDMMRPILFEVSPAKPTVLSATPYTLWTTPPRMALAWVNNAVSPAVTRYTLQRATNSGFTGTVVSLYVGPTATSYVDKTVGLRTRYYYRIRAESTNGYSDWSNVANGLTPGQLPLPPTNLHTTGMTASSISVAWTNQVGGGVVSGITVQRANASGGPWTTVASLAPSATSRTITGLTTKRTYYIRVLAVNVDGYRPSSVISATTP